MGRLRGSGDVTAPTVDDADVTAPTSTTRRPEVISPCSIFCMSGGFDSLPGGTWWAVACQVDRWMMAATHPAGFGGLPVAVATGSDFAAVSLRRSGVVVLPRRRSPALCLALYCSSFAAPFGRRLREPVPYLGACLRRCPPQATVSDTRPCSRSSSAAPYGSWPWNLYPI